MTDLPATAAAGPDDHDNFGALVGWDSDDLGEKIVLKMQSVRAHHRRHEGEVSRFNYFLTKNQAVVLGNYLFAIAGQTPPPARKRGWLARLLGR